jgi:hypothetical protein
MRTPQFEMRLKSLKTHTLNATTQARIEARLAERGPGPGAYCSNLPDPRAVPKTEAAKVEQDAHYPFMRYRAQ